MVALTTGSMLSMWISELITNEDLGNGSSMLIAINIISNISFNVSDFSLNLISFENIVIASSILIFYLLTVCLIAFVQDSYKKVFFVSARQLTRESVDLKDSFIPIKINPGGIMPLVLSSTFATVLLNPFIGTQTIGFLKELSMMIINLIILIWVSTVYSRVTLNPKELARRLRLMGCSIPGLKPGKETEQYLKKVISRAGCIGGIYLAFIAFSPLIINKVFHFTVFRSLASLVILMGVVSEVSSQVQGYLLSKKYEEFLKK
jgi:preprotein translocase subunit SecY